MSEPFRFKEFNIVQDKAAMKVGTDGVLLGSWASAPECYRILDIGTGTGLIALMSAQRFSGATVEAVEIDATAASEAKENFEKSPWSDRLTLHHCRIQDFSSEEYFDLIISNPPFFENSKHSGDSAKDLARHTDQLAFTELIFAANNLMKEKGTFSVIIPAKQSEKFARLSQAQGLFCNKICRVKPTESKEPIRAMMNFNKFKTNREEEELIIEENGRHNYSSEYIRLTEDFYLNF